MKKTYQIIIGVLLGSTLTACSDYLDVESPAKNDDTFVTSSTDETFKALSWAYAEYRQNCAAGANYHWEDCTSDAEYYPEFNLRTTQLACLCPKKQKSAVNSHNLILFTVLSHVPVE